MEDFYYTQDTLPRVVSETWTDTGKIRITDVIGDRGVPISEFHMGDMHMPLYPRRGPLEVVVNDYDQIELHHSIDLVQVLTPEERLDLQRDLQNVLNTWARAKGIPVE